VAHECLNGTEAVAAARDWSFAECADHAWCEHIGGSFVRTTSSAPSGVASVAEEVHLCARGPSRLLMRTSETTR